MRQFYTVYETSFEIFPFFFPKDSKNLTSCDIGIWEVEAKRHLNIVNKERKNLWKTLFAAEIFFIILNKIVQIWDHFFPLISPNDSEYLKILDIGLYKVVAKRPLNGVRKCSRQIDKQTKKKTYEHFIL